MSSAEQGEQVTFHFIKSKHHRVIHGDGVWGGPTPQGNIAISFYSEMGTLPGNVTHAVSEGKLGEELDRNYKAGFVRELEFTVLVSPATAAGIAEWLTAYIKQLGGAQK